MIQTILTGFSSRNNIEKIKIKTIAVVFVIVYLTYNQNALNISSM